MLLCRALPKTRNAWMPLLSVWILSPRKKNDYRAPFLRYLRSLCSFCWYFVIWLAVCSCILHFDFMNWFVETPFRSCMHQVVSSQPNSIELRTGRSLLCDCICCCCCCCCSWWCCCWWWWWCFFHCSMTKTLPQWMRCWFCFDCDWFDPWACWKAWSYVVKS